MYAKMMHTHLKYFKISECKNLNMRFIIPHSHFHEFIHIHISYFVGTFFVQLLNINPGGYMYYYERLKQHCMLGVF